MNTSTEQVPLDVGIAIGRIMASREHRLYLRQKKKENIKRSVKELASAERNARIFGMYDDCGPSYLSDLDEARCLHRQAVADLEILQKLEKYTKLLKHRFKEEYPEWIPLLNRMLEEQTVEIQNNTRERMNNER